ncbi:hypothetical protein DF186_25155, partial [Enterococcus hirae]
EGSTAGNRVVTAVPCPWSPTGHGVVTGDPRDDLGELVPRGDVDRPVDRFVPRPHEPADHVAGAVADQVRDHVGRVVE